MAMYKQSRSDRMDESLGMRRGKESGKMQSYKDRRDESYGMKDKGVMGHEKKPMSCNPLKAQQADLSRLKMEPMDYRGTPKQAFDYKY